MDAVMQELFSMVWLGFGVALFAVVLAGVLRSHTFKGWWGERKVRYWLQQGLDPKTYFGLHNITLRLPDGSTTQIDHVVISPYGIFVLETKHFQGWIFGGEKQATWTQSIYRHRSSFPSPLRQNWRHIQALQELLDVPLQHLHSVVVFSGDSLFKTDMPAHVTQGRGCVAYILQHQRPVWSIQETAQWVDKLAQLRLKASRATDQAHVQHLRQRHAQPAISRKVLPSHGGKLAPRVTSAQPVRAVDSLAHNDQATPVQPVLAASVANEKTAAVAVSLAACPECGNELVHRSLQDSSGATRYFLRCACFPHCRFVQSEAFNKG